MNELLEKTDAGRNPGSEPPAPAPVGVPKKPPGVPPVGNAATPPLPAVPIGKPGYAFKFDLKTSAGQEERREHERIRKNDKRAANRAAEPAVLSPASVAGPLPATNGEQMPGNGAAGVALAVETFVPWVGADVSDFTDELVELAETKRVVDFVAMAKEANMPKKFIEEVEKKSHYPANSKSSLKRCLADCAAKWLNKSGVSSKSKEEVKVLFCLVTIKLQGVRLKRDFAAIIAADQAERAKADAEKPQPAETQKLRKGDSVF